jgi:hypothetical protein
MPGERVLINFFYARPAGHAVEALHYCLGHHAADPEREIAVALNADTPVRLAGYCPFVSAAYAIEHPFVEPGTDSRARLAGVPRRWDWVLDEVRVLLQPRPVPLDHPRHGPLPVLQPVRCARDRR